MTTFRTTFSIKESRQKINYSSNILLAGSCFTENIGKKLNYYKFNAHINPFGIIFNPYSLTESLGKLIKKEYFTKKDLYFFNNKWLSLWHHGSFAKTTAEEALAEINNGIEKGHAFINKADFLIITFGTAWVYELKSNRQIVANCHKIPQKEFEKRLLEINEIVSDFQLLINELKQINNKLQLCFTLSPVRHWRDGAVENQLSKSTLHVAIQKIIAQNKMCSYFPAYEIVMDDLRDYRFYEADMIHPNQQAVDYIWEKFKLSNVNEQTFVMMEKIAKLKTAMNHRPLDPGSAAHKRFMQQQFQLVNQLHEQLPALDFSEEINYFNAGN